MSKNVFKRKKRGRKKEMLSNVELQSMFVGRPVGECEEELKNALFHRRHEKDEIISFFLNPDTASLEAKITKLKEELKKGKRGGEIKWETDLQKKNWMKSLG